MPNLYGLDGNYRAGLSHQQQLRMFNQLDSHDTALFKTLLGRERRRPLAVVLARSTWPVHLAFITAMK
ncbi:hypothetical protein ACLK1T_05155 [Escherichia coli]